MLTASRTKCIHHKLRSLFPQRLDTAHQNGYCQPKSAIRMVRKHSSPVVRWYSAETPTNLSSSFDRNSVDKLLGEIRSGNRRTLSKMITMGT